MQALRSASRCSHLRSACLRSSFIARCSRHAAAHQRSCSTSNAVTSAVCIAPREEHLQHLASLLAQQREIGDCYLLYGSVGAGKSVFSRAFIRAAADDLQLAVPSPTYLLQLTYAEQGGPPIHHFDLYRIDAGQDMSRLDLASSFSSSVCLVEWAERLQQQLLPPQRLEVRIRIMSDQVVGGVSSSDSSICGERLQQVQQQFLQDINKQQQRQQPVALQETLLLPTPVLQDAAAAVEDSYLLGDISGDDDVEHEEDEIFTDQRWRSVEFTAVGERWVERLQQLARELQQQRPAAE